MCVNHAHECKATCIKYVKQKLKAKRSLRSHKVPSCRFWHFRVKRINRKLRRRRGKPLVGTPYIAETDDRNQEFRCQARREQTFHSTSNDAAQVSNRCNVDFQFLFCAPPAPPDEQDGRNSAPQSACSTEAPPPPAPKRRRRWTKAALTTVASQPRLAPSTAFLPGEASLSLAVRRCIHGFTTAFQQGRCPGLLHHTKYPGKSRESLMPLFMTMTQGIQCLESQELQEEAEAEAARRNRLEEDGAAQPGLKQRKTLEVLARRARRVTIRLSSMGNRCFWLSPAELVVHIFTDGDCLQSHDNARLFTRQLQWVMQECKRRLNAEAIRDEVLTTHMSAQAVAFHSAPQQSVDDNDEEHSVDFDNVEACTTSTNMADDYAHRGDA